MNHLLGPRHARGYRKARRTGAWVGIVVVAAAAVVAARPVTAAAQGASPAAVTSLVHRGVMPITTPGQRASSSMRSPRSGPSQGIAANPHLTYYGGKVVASVQVNMVLYGNSATDTYQPEVSDSSTTNGTSLASFYTGVTSSTYFDWLSEYNAAGVRIGRGSFGSLTAIAPDPTRDLATIDDTQIQAELHAQVLAHTLPQPTANTLYAVYFPAGKTITMGTSVSGGQFCAYHGTVPASGGVGELYYSVLPDFTTGGMTVGCGSGTRQQNEMSVSSHELVEAVTDPEVGLPNPVLSWYDTQQGTNGDDGEIGDICNAEQTAVTGGDGHPYTVQLEWSNRQNNCVSSYAPGLGVVAVNDNSSWGISSEGTSFSGPTQWSSSAFYGNVTTLSGVVTPPDAVGGRTHVSLVAVNTNGVWVMAPAGQGYATPQQWYAGAPAIGSRATLLADVNGDGRADLVAVGNNGTQVMLSTGSSFSPPQPWSSTAFYGNRATLATDLNGDGKADLIAVNDTSIYVMLANPGPGATGFGLPKLWSSVAFYGSQATIAGNISGNGYGSVIAINSDSVWVVSAGANAFAPPRRWLNGGFYGNIATLVSDVNGDGIADLVAVNSASVYVTEPNGAGFGPPQLWSSGAFYGNRANLVAN